MLRYSGDGGTTSSDLLAWPRRPNSRTRRPSNTTLKFPTNTGPVSSGPKESRIEPNNRRGVVEEKKKIHEFLTGVENSGKAWFSQVYTNPNGDVVHDVVINKIETDKEGGDWASDIIEAVNMICFTMRVHSNLVGSVPGKAQTNNSGSDKRELYTIAQALQKPYHDLLFTVHNLVIRFNEWKGAYPDCPFIMLTTLDEKNDAKTVTVNTPEI